MASKINKGEILAKFFDDGEYTALFADGAVSAACGYAAGQQAYAVYQNGEAVTVKDVEKNIKVLEMAAQTGCPVVTFYNSVGAKLTEGLDVLTVSAKLNAQIAKVSGVVPQVAVVLGVCGGTSALSAANADVCIMAEGAELFFTAPFTSAAKGDKVADAGSAAAAAKANKPAQPRKKAKITLEILCTMLKGAGTLTKAVFGALRITKIQVRLGVRGEDPAAAARSYGKLQAWLYPVLGVLDRFLWLQFDELRILPDFGSGQPTVEDRVSCRVSAQALFIVLAAVRVLYEFWRKKVLDIFL